MSIELKHPFADSHQGRRASLIGSAAKVMSYGPYSYIKAAALGFVIGGLLFAIGLLIMPPPIDPRAVNYLSVCAIGGAALAIISAMLGNYVIGRRIREAQELQRVVFGGGSLPPHISPKDFPGMRL